MPFCAGLTTATVSLAFATLAVAANAVSASASEDTVALIQHLSQQFSDASATDDVATYQKLLDDRVVFMGEDGSTTTKREIIAGATPGAKTTARTLTQSDFHVQIHGDVAVTSFTDNLKQPFFGQTFTSTFRSTEVWLHETSGWKMISSQTLEAYEDPPAATLASSVLDEYVGTYTAGPGYTVTIARDGDGITTSANGAKPTKLAAELKDVFFIAGARGRRIFRRNDAGAVIGYVSRREGHDLVLTRVS